MPMYPSSIESRVSTTIEDRVIFVLREMRTNVGYGCWQGLADQTGVVAQRWCKAFTAQQRPTPDMLQALCRLKPEYAFWIATGITDAEHGHKAPESALPFPEWRGERASDEAAVDYFKASLEILDLLAIAARVDVQDRAARMEAFGCELVRDQWQPNEVVDAAACELREDVDPILESLREWRNAVRDEPTGDRRSASVCGNYPSVD